MKKSTTSMAGSALAQVDLEQRCVALLCDLEASVRASQKALLSRNLADIERLTSEQRELRDALSVFFSEDGGSRKAKLTPAVRAIAARVLALGRLQSGLLARAQRRVHALSSLRGATQFACGPMDRNFAVQPGIVSSEGA